MGDKIVNTILVKHKVTLENKTIHSPPLHSKLGWFLFSTQVAGTAVQHCKQGMGMESSIVAFEVGKMSEKPFRAKFFN